MFVSRKKFNDLVATVKANSSLISVLLHKIRDAEVRLSQSECKHVFAYKETDINASMYVSSMPVAGQSFYYKHSFLNEKTAHVIFKCSLCGKNVGKLESELTAKEKQALTVLGVIKAKKS